MTDHIGKIYFPPSRYSHFKQEVWLNLIISLYFINGIGSQERISLKKTSNIYFVLLYAKISYYGKNKLNDHYCFLRSLSSETMQDLK